MQMSMTSEWTQLTGSSAQEADAADAKRPSVGASLINQNVVAHMNRYINSVDTRNQSVNAKIATQQASQRTAPTQAKRDVGRGFGAL